MIECEAMASGVYAGPKKCGGTPMRRLWFTAAGLVFLCGFGVLVTPTKGEQPPVPSVLGDKSEKTCGSHGTQIEFVGTPTEAAKQAKKENKLVFVLHVSGHFEDPRFT